MLKNSIFHIDKNNLLKFAKYYLPNKKSLANFGKLWQNSICETLENLPKQIVFGKLCQIEFAK